MKFKQVNLNNLSLLVPYLKMQPYRICDFSPLSIFIWAEYFQYEYLIHNNFLYLRGIYQDSLCYLFPLGTGDINEAILFLKQYTTATNTKLIFADVPTPALEVLNSSSDDLIITPTYYDYVYNISDLITLTGNKYKRQRNHINKFIKRYNNYQYQNITVDDIPLIFEFLDEFSLEMANKKCHQSFRYETLKAKEVIKNYEILKPIGGIIKVGHKIVALAIGEIIDDTIHIHIEKALRKYPGSYAVINRDFLKHNYQDNLKYVNRAEDVGDTGLRKAKLSYRPVKLLKKYYVTVKE